MNILQIALCFVSVTQPLEVYAHSRPDLPAEVVAFRDWVAAHGRSGFTTKDGKPLQSLADVETLRLTGPDRPRTPEDFALITGLTSLKVLHIRNIRLSDMSPVGKLAGLEELRISEATIKNDNLRFLSDLTNLKVLELRNVGLTELPSLAALDNLEAVLIQYRSKTRTYRKIDDLSPIKELSNIKSLKVVNCPVSELPVAGLSKLEVLNFSETDVADLRPLASLTELRELTLSYTRVEDIRPLAGLRSLILLDLFDTQVSDLTPLAGLGELTMLELAGVPISDVTPLATLTRLRSLRLSSSKLSDIRPLARLDNLKTLSLGFSSISDVTPLSDLTNLRSLNIGAWHIRDWSPIVRIPNLELLVVIGKPRDGAEVSHLQRARPRVTVLWGWRNVDWNNAIRLKGR